MNPNKSMCISLDHSPEYAMVDIIPNDKLLWLINLSRNFHRGTYFLKYNDMYFTEFKMISKPEYMNYMTNTGPARLLLHTNYNLKLEFTLYHRIPIRMNLMTAREFHKALDISKENFSISK